MRVEYAPRALRDLRDIGSYHRATAGNEVAAAIARRIEHVVDRLGQQPLIAPRVSSRADVRVALVLRYPYKIFYRVRPNRVQILHIRHTARRPWHPE